MRYTISGSQHKEAALNLRPFTTGGALEGIVGRGYGSGRLWGHAKRVFQRDFDKIDYVILSYMTPIAWHTPRGWVRVVNHFSMTTSKHQSAIWYLPNAEEVGLNWSRLNVTDMQKFMLRRGAELAGRGGYLITSVQRRTAQSLANRGLGSLKYSRFVTEPSLAERIV